MPILYFIFSVLGLAVTVASVNAEEPETTIALNDKNHIIYNGIITNDANQSLFDLYALSTNKPQRLVISSGGGDIQLGMDLGEWLFKHKLDIEIDRCYSSCANFVFPAARIKYLRKNSELMWHGSAWQKSWDNDAELDTVLGRYLQKSRQREIGFFMRVGVKRQITSYGDDKLRWYERLLNYTPWSYAGFDYSLADMQRWGIDQIELIDGEWDRFKYPQENGPKTKRVEILAQDYPSLDITDKN